MADPGYYLNPANLTDYFPSLRWTGQDVPSSGELAMPPPNPAAPPQGLQRAAWDATIQPMYDIGMGVGSVVGGQGWNSPEATAGFLAAIGSLPPMKAGALKSISRTAQEFQAALRAHLEGAGYHVFTPPNPNSLSKYLSVGNKSEFHSGVDPLGRVGVRISDHPGYEGNQFDFRTVGGRIDRDPEEVAAKIIEALTKNEIVPTVRTSRSGIKAYHGSPHDFDRFDISKIGTGEGAQAYGHGLYFSENPSVAQTYKYTTNMPVGMNTITARHAFRAMQDASKKGLAGEEAMSYARNRLSEQGRNAGNAEIQRSYYDAANNLEQLVSNRPGKMYEVNIDAKPEQFLDWDRPLVGQSPQVQKLANDLIGSPPTGAELYKALSEKRMPVLPPDIPGRPKGWSYIQRGDEGQPGATSTLREAGVPGIRYLDQGSRRAVELQKIIDQSISADRVRLAKQELEQIKPTSNYVLFRDDIIDILKKYGIAGLAAFGAWQGPGDVTKPKPMMQ
jgi:hypothetical protein